jgi:dienelactone hydrolase
MTTAQLTRRAVRPHTAPEPRADRAGRGESVAFRVAMAVIALAVVDDAFVHREAGRSIGDHLASGLVPVALAAVFAVAYPRLRAGARSTLALVCGTLAVTAGVADGIRHVAVERFAGDDLTAILAAAAGAALVLAGAVTLWRTRRLDERRLRRYGRRLIIGLCAAVAAYLVVLPVAFAIVATHKARSPVTAADVGRAYERVTFTTSDGLTLVGWYVPSGNRAAIIAFPGRSNTVPHARMLAGHGYGVLLFDRRGEGRSEGDYDAFGWGGDKDLAAAITFLRGRRDVDQSRIGGLGLSVGGELLLQTAAQDRRLAAVVSEGAGVRALSEHLETPGLGSAQKWLSNWVVQNAAVAVLSNSSAPPSLTDLVPRIAPRPVLILEAEHGNDSENLSRVYYAAARRPKAYWRVPGSGHTGGLAAQPQEYERRVVGFFDRALLRDPATTDGRS